MEPVTDRFYFLQAVIHWNVLHKRVGVVLIVHSDAIVLQSIAYYQIVHMQDKIVSDYLFKDLPAYGNTCRLVFNNNLWNPGPVINHRITPAAHSVEFN